MKRLPPPGPVPGGHGPTRPVPAAAATEPRERGSVTAELAVGLVPVAAALLLAGWLAAAGTQQVHVQLAAGAAARALARGEEPALVERRTVEAVGPGASTQQRTQGGLVRVRVAVPVPVPLLGGALELSGEAVSPVEAPPP